MKNNYEIKLIKSNKKIFNKNDLKQFEEELYNAFSNVKNSWVIENYEYVKKDRIRPKMKYDDVFIYVVKNNNKIISGISGHANMEIELQIEKLGFKINKKRTFAEGLNFFIKAGYGKDIFMILDEFFNQILYELKKANVQDLFLTCNKKHVAMYELVGFEIIDEKEINTKTEYLMRYMVC